MQYLPATSVVFWLIALIGIGIIFIGARFLMVPQIAARDFGVPVREDDNPAYLSAKGVRDIASGLLAIALLWLKVSPGVLAAFLFIASLIPVGDCLDVYANARPRNVPALFIHGGTAVFMWVLGVLLLRA